MRHANWRSLCSRTAAATFFLLAVGDGIGTPQQGQERETWLQAIVIGDVAIVGVPAELFTKLGLDIKQRSPLKNTYIAELANDWIGYLPDLEGHKLGGYQTWAGLHSYAEPGTGERMVDEAVKLLNELAQSK